MNEIITFSSQDPPFELFQKLQKQPRPEFIPLSSICYLSLKKGSPQARLNTTIVNDIHGILHPCGMIGHFEAIDLEAGITLLKRAKKDLLNEGAAIVIGPMNGSTWSQYRLSLEPRGKDKLFHPSTFAGEPQNPSNYPAIFEAAGFQVIDRYESRIVNDLTCREQQAHKLQKKMDRLEISLSSLNLQKYEEELYEIFKLSTEEFAENPYYRSIDFNHFKGLYEDIKPYLDPELILLAHNKNGELVGFVFSYPDLTCIAEDLPLRLVFKTLAVSKKMRSSGLGVYLQDALHLIAHRHGYTSVIHALMHSDNNSRMLSVKGYHSKLFKRYALYASSKI